MFKSQIEYKTFKSEIEYNNNESPPAIARLDGCTKFQDTPKSLRTMCLDRNTGRVIRHWYTNLDGSFNFNINNDYIGTEDLFIVSFDDTNGDERENAAIQDHIKPTEE